MSYSSNISISGRFPIYEASFVLRLPYEERRLPLIQFRVRQPISALGFENTSAFRYKTALNDSNSPSPFFRLKCSISGKIGFSDSSSYGDGRSGKFKQLDKPSSVSNFL